MIEKTTVEEKLRSIPSSYTRKTVMFIGRYHHNIPSQLKQWQKAFPNLDITYSTVHASKGLESDFIFIMDVNEDVFPAKNTAQGMEGVLLMLDEIEHAEERRLFYVALTRAKHLCWICTDPMKTSPFIRELYYDKYPVTFEINTEQWSVKKYNFN